MIIIEHNIVILIDMADSFASAVWIDCLFGLKARYPQASFYPVFLLPQMENLAVEEAAVIGAAVTELSQLSQGRWTPTDINTGEDYPCDEPFGRSLICSNVHRYKTTPHSYNWWMLC